MEYQFIDCNCSIGRKQLPDLNVDYSKSAVKSALLGVNVKKAFCSHNGAVRGGDFKDNRILKEEIKDDDFFLPSYTLIINNGKEDSAEEFESILKKDKIKLMNMNNAAQGRPLDLFTLSDYFDIMDECGITLNLPLSSVTDKWLSEVLSCYKSLKLVLCRYSYSNSISIRKLMRLYDNIFVDTSYSQSDGIESLVKSFGSERVVFSSYAPEISPAGFTGRIILASLSRAEKDNIAYRNIMRMTGEKII